MLTDTAPPGNRDFEYLPSRQLVTADVQSHSIKHNFALATWRKKNAGNHWVLVCERRLKRGEICPEVLCKAQVCFAKSTSKKHAEYSYYNQKNEPVF